MLDVVKFLRDFWKGLQLLSIRHFVGALALCVGLAALRHDHIDWWANVGLAAFLNPVVLGAIVLALLLLKYDRRIGSLLRTADLSSVDRSYRAVSQISRLHDHLRKWTLSHSVPLGYMLASTYMKTHSAQVGINLGDSAVSDAQTRGKLVHHQFLVGISKFASSALAEEKDRELALSSIFSTIDSYLSPAVSEIVRVTYADGPGISSTLSGLLRAHFVAVLPYQFRAKIITNLATLQLDPALFGWLSGRVFHLLIEVSLRDDQVALEELRSLCTEVTTGLVSSRGNEQQTLEAKFDARTVLMSRISSRIGP